MAVLTPNVLDQIRTERWALSNAQRRVADAVLSKPENVIHASISALARDAGVSDPTILRFCREIGCTGFKEFKLRLAQSLVSKPFFVHAGITATDPTEIYSLKVIDSTIDMVIDIRNRLDNTEIERATEALAAAGDTGRIEFYGFGASGVVAMDAQYKFFFLVAPCFAYTDAHMQCMSASTLTPQDVVVAISHTGKTRELLESVDIALETGATVIAITTRDSPLANIATILLAADVPEDTEVYTPSISRIVHLLLVDVLAVGTSLRHGKRTEARVSAMKSVLRSKRFKGGEMPGLNTVPATR